MRKDPALLWQQYLSLVESVLRDSLRSAVCLGVYAKHNCSTCCYLFARCAKPQAKASAMCTAAVLRHAGMLGFVCCLQLCKLNAVAQKHIEVGQMHARQRMLAHPMFRVQESLL